jgi:hypothetical protein
MATYKVLQDIEAEDKILGPLTLKQFIFAIITVVLCFMAFFLGRVNVLLAAPWLFPIAFFGFMAAPIGRDQPNDVWLAARLRFLIKPRKRVWDQAGMQELVTITVPKKIEISRTDGLSQKEVKSRLSALSSLMDTRGWAVKNSDSAPTYSPGSYGGSAVGNDRLIDLSNFAPEATISEVHDSEDIMDTANNSVAQRIDNAIKKQHEEKISSLKSGFRNGTIASDTIPPIDYSFMDREQPKLDPGYTTFGARVVNPGSEATDDFTQQSTPAISKTEEEQFLSKIHHDQELSKVIASSNHEHRINPIERPADASQKKPELTTAHTAPDVILKQLGQANDISVESIAKLANHAQQEKAFNQDDVVSLH